MRGAAWKRSSYLDHWKNRTRLQPADAFAPQLLTRRVTVFCTERSLSRITFRISEKINGAYYADPTTFWSKPNGRTEAAGGNSRQTRRLGVSCFPDRL